MRRVRIPFVDIKSLIPVVSVNVCGEQTFAIIDSGSESTLVDIEFARKNKAVFKFEKKKETANYIGLSKTETVPIIQAETEIMFNGIPPKVPLKAEVFDLQHAISTMEKDNGISPRILIGSDFLKKYYAKLDYESNELII